MDATTVLAIISCAVVFCGWLVLPHSPTSTKPSVVRKKQEREPVAASA